jgi:hypothetical protein
VLLTESACAVNQRIKAKFFRMDMFGNLYARLGGDFYGLSCRGPISLIAITNGKASVLAHLQDGGNGFEADVVARILETLATRGSLDPQLTFAKAAGTAAS